MAQFKKIGTKKNQIGGSGGERKKNPGVNPAQVSLILKHVQRYTQTDSEVRPHNINGQAMLPDSTGIRFSKNLQHIFGQKEC